MNDGPRGFQNSRTFRAACRCLAGLLIIGATACGNTASPPLAIRGETMGTYYLVKLGVKPGAEVDLAALGNRIKDRLEAINAQMSTYRPDSELSRFNAHTGDDWFPVSEEVVQVVDAALEISRQTDGAFDPTVGPLVNLWNFGPEPSTEDIPTEEAIEQARARVDFRAVETQADPPALRKTLPGIYLDLSAIAKGYAVDELVRLASQEQVTGCMVDIGGEIGVRGAKPDGSPWRVALRDPQSPWSAVGQRVLELREGGLATSGDYFNFVEIDGQRYSHILDPRTGRPVEHALTSVSVVAKNCLQADALATAILVLGPRAGLEFAESRGAAAYLLTRDGNALRESFAGSFEAYISPQPSKPEAEVP